MPLGFKSDDEAQFLVFGGMNPDYSRMKRTCVFTTSLSDFNKSEFVELKQNGESEELYVSEIFNFNQYFPLPKEI